MQRITAARTRALLTCVTATLFLALAVTGASARNLRISNQNVRAVWSALRFIVGGNTISCHVTLEGSFVEATAAKVVGSLFGRVTRAAVNTCTGGSATILNATLPWHIVYRGFSGTLPRIRTVQFGILGVSFEIQPSGSLACLAATEANHPATGNVVLEESGSGTVTELVTLVEAEIPLRGGGGLCAFGGEGHYEGSSQMTVLNSTTRITITLI